MQESSRCPAHNGDLSPAAGSAASAERKLTAFRVGQHQAKIEPAPRWREWMNETRQRGANRCLPLLIANEAGWVMRNPVGFTVVWDGTAEPSATTIDLDDDVPAHARLADSHFGDGILTFEVPFLFRTPRGYNLWVRGPSNWPKDGICALEGIVETDWAVATFTMNWKLTRPDHPVRFEAGEPYCMLVPQRRGELASFSPALRSLGSDETEYRAHAEWSRSRHELQVKKFLAQYSRDFEDFGNAWQRHYFKGRCPNGATAPEHETKLRLGAFEPAD